MPIKPTDAKKLAEEFNTMELSSLMDASDELMRIVMEAGDMEKAEGAAMAAAEMAAALVVRKQGGVRELAKRVRERVATDEPAKTEEPTPPSGPQILVPDPSEAD